MTERSRRRLATDAAAPADVTSAVSPQHDATVDVGSDSTVAAAATGASDAREPVIEGSSAAAASTAAASPGWCLYLIECRNGSYYAGITNRLDARYAAHVAGRGARYTRANPPIRLLGSRWFADRSAAARAEWQIRQLPRAGKLAFLAKAGDEAESVA